MQEVRGGVVKPRAANKGKSPMGWFSGKPTSRGMRGEQIAEAHLKHLGYRILARNWKNRFGEIDLLARATDGSLVLVEVKTGTRGQTPPETRVNAEKQHQLTALAAQAARRYARNDKVRFDVIAVELPPDGATGDAEPVVRHIEAAFESRV
jgi:putative endonuclease